MSDSTFFKASRAGVVVRGRKLTAWFPHIAAEEDYASNPPNSILFNECVCEREGGWVASVCDKKGKSKCVLLNVQFQLTAETLSHSQTHLSME